MFFGSKPPGVQKTVKGPRRSKHFKWRSSCMFLRELIFLKGAPECHTNRWYRWQGETGDVIKPCQRESVKRILHQQRENENADIFKMYVDAVRSGLNRGHGDEDLRNIRFFLKTDASRVWMLPVIWKPADLCHSFFQPPPIDRMIDWGSSFCWRRKEIGTFGKNKDGRERNLKIRLFCLSALS